MALVLLYAVSGTAFFVYLFLKFLRTGLHATDRNKWDIFRQSLAINQKIRTDFSYALVFLSLLAGLFIFGTTVVLLFQHFAERQE